MEILGYILPQFWFGTIIFILFIYLPCSIYMDANKHREEKTLILKFLHWYIGDVNADRQGYSIKPSRAGHIRVILTIYILGWLYVIYYY